MTVDSLYDLRDDTLLEEKDKKVITLLLQAITDWPTKVDTVEKFLIELKRFLKTDNLSHEAITAGMQNLYPEECLWEMEALSSILDITQTKKEASLESILYQHNIIDYQG